MKVCFLLDGDCLWRVVEVFGDGSVSIVCLPIPYSFCLFLSLFVWLIWLIDLIDRFDWLIDWLILADRHIWKWTIFFLFTSVFLDVFHSTSFSSDWQSNPAIICGICVSLRNTVNRNQLMFNFITSLSSLQYSTHMFFFMRILNTSSSSLRYTSLIA